MIVDVDFSGEREKMLAYCHEVVDNNPEHFKHLPSQYRGDKDLALKSLRAQSLRSSFLVHISDGLCDDEDVVFEAISKCPLSDEFEFASSRLKDDKQFVIKCMPVCSQWEGWYARKYLGAASARLRDDKDVVLSAVKICGSALQCASARLKDDEEVVTSAIIQSGEAITYASDRLKNSRDLVLQAVSNAGIAFAGVPSFQDDKEIALIAVQSCGTVIRYASQRLQEDRDVVLAMIKSNPDMLLRVSDDWKEDPEVMDILRGK